MRDESVDSAVAQVLPALAEGRIRPTVDSVVAFDEAPLALARMRSNEAIGKIVLQMPDVVSAMSRNVTQSG